MAFSKCEEEISLPRLGAEEVAGWMIKMSRTGLGAEQCELMRELCGMVRPTMTVVEWERFIRIIAATRL